MTMNVRGDGSRYQDSAEQHRVLADISDDDARTGENLDCNVTLGDLIVQTLIGRELIPGVTGSHEDYESFEHAFLQRIALELRAVNVAVAASLTTDDPAADPFSTEQACEYLRGLARRVEAGAALASRLRDARWGNPSFGGGEAFLAEQAAKFRADRANEDPNNPAVQAAERPMATKGKRAEVKS